MPIRPEERSRYPKNWREISDQIKKLAGYQCECVGECGLHPPNPEPRRCIERHDHRAVFAQGVVILTVAHLDHQPENCARENLKAMCQRCHLRYDQKHHQKTRREGIERAGQQRLPGVLG